MVITLPARAIVLVVATLATAIGCQSDHTIAPARDIGKNAMRDSGNDSDGSSEDLGTRARDVGTADTRLDQAPDQSVDLGPMREPFPTFSIGPYRDALGIATGSMKTLAAAYDSSESYTRVASQGYVLQSIGLLLQATVGYEFEERDELIVLALGEIDELKSVSDRVTSGGPAFGLPDAWDAFGDGSTNPAYTAYTWQSGMAALGVAQVANALKKLGHPEADAVRTFGEELVGYWSNYYSVVADGGFYWYSDRPDDAIAVHNTSVLIAMAGQVLTHAGSAPQFGARSEAVADLLWARMSGNPTNGYRWNYADDGMAEERRVSEDISHGAFDLMFMRFARDEGWWSDTQMRGIGRTLTGPMWSGNPVRLNGRVDGTSSGREWTHSRAAAIGYAAHGDSRGGDPIVFDMARSILASSYLTRFARPVAGATVGAPQLLALTLLLVNQPDAFHGESGWRKVAGPGDDDIPTEPGGIRFYTSDWAPAADVTVGGLTWPARQATAPLANLVVDLEPDFGGRVVVALTYRSEVAGTIEQYDGSQYRPLASLPATTDEDGELRWFRTTFELDAASRYDYQGGVPGVNILLQLTSTPAVHLLEAWPVGQ